MDKFQLLRISLELTQWVTKLLLSVDITILTLWNRYSHQLRSWRRSFPWEEGQIHNKWSITPKTSQVSGPKPQNVLLQIVSNAGCIEKSEFGVATSTKSSFNDLKNFHQVQYFGSTHMSTTPSMTTPPWRWEQLTTQLCWLMRLR